jgi:FtsH-binding integral membrane protein
MTNDCADHVQQKITDDAALHRVAIYVAGGLVASCVALAATNIGFERHTWWGWLLIGAPLAWLSFLGTVALTVGMLRVVVGALRWSSLLMWGTDAEISASASRWKGPHMRHLDASVSELVSAA